MKCALCGKKLSFLNAFRCSVCGQFFCEEYRLPESHGCKKERTPAIISGKPPEKEHSLSKMKIRAPILFEEPKITIPKLLFPYNEDYLKYALFETLEKLQAQALLEPEVIGRRLKPDLVWLDKNIILECENFYKGDRKNLGNSITRLQIRARTRHGLLRSTVEIHNHNSKRGNLQRVRRMG